MTNSDADAATWEPIVVEQAIPVGTDFIILEVMAYENIYNDVSGTEFDGHFADMVSFAIVPEPATLMLLAAGAALLRKKRQ